MTAPLPGDGDRAGPVPWWSDDRVELHLGDCLAVMRQMPDASVDAVVTDPPAAISFMGREWDGSRGGRDRWIAWLAERMQEACRVLKPGGHALVWSLPRTSGWTQMALEDAGFEVRDCIVHIFGTGYPKSRNVSKDIDAAAGAERPVVGSRLGRPGVSRTGANLGAGFSRALEGREDRPSPALDITGPATADAARWDGWGTALKPGQEMWWLVRKPIAGTVAATVQQHGTGALNIAACRVGTGQRTNNAGGSSSLQRVSRVESGYRPTVTTSEGEASEVAGRWPANVVFTHSATCEVVGSRIIRGDSRSGQDRGERPGGFGDVGADGGSEKPNGALHGDQVAEVFACAPDCPVAELDRQSGLLTSWGSKTNREIVTGNQVLGDMSMSPRRVGPQNQHMDSGGASRFFHAFRYQAKAPSSERPRGEDGSAHVTVKSLGLMRHLVRLITPPGGTVLDCYAGSGPTAEACLIEGFDCILIELEQSSAELIRTRLRKDIQPVMFAS